MDKAELGAFFLPLDSVHKPSVSKQTSHETNILMECFIAKNISSTLNLMIESLRPQESGIADDTIPAPPVYRRLLSSTLIPQKSGWSIGQGHHRCYLQVNHPQMGRVTCPEAHNAKWCIVHNICQVRKSHRVVDIATPHVSSVGAHQSMRFSSCVGRPLMSGVISPLMKIFSLV